jgi:hypothetical protein
LVSNYSAALRPRQNICRVVHGWQNPVAELLDFHGGNCETPSVQERLEEWTRCRVWSTIWKQWKRGLVEFVELRKRDVNLRLAATTTGSAYGLCQSARRIRFALALPNAYFGALRLPRLTIRWSLNPPIRHLRTPM